MKSTSVTELKKRLSAHLESVRAGETFVVTDHNVPVGVLTPLPTGLASARVSALVAAGTIKPPERSLDLNAFLALPKAKYNAGLCSALDEERDGR